MPGGDSGPTTKLRDTVVSAAASILFRAGTIRDRFGHTILEKALEELAGNNSLDAEPFTFGGLCSRMLAWSINGFATLYGINPRYARNAVRQKGAATAFCNLAETIATSGIHRPLSLSSPIAVVWSLSKKCNLRCAHCYQDARSSFSDEMTPDEQLQIADELGATGVALVVLSGGEPLLNPDIFSLIQRILEHDVAVALDSNGVLIDASMAARLRNAGIESVQISIDSISPEHHDKFRGLRGAFERAREAVLNCSKQGIFTTVATTVTRRNIDEMGELANLAKNWGASRLAIFDLVPAGRGLDLVDEAISDQEKIRLMQDVIETSRSGDIEVILELPQLVPYTMAEEDGRENDSQKRSDAFCVDKFTVTSYFNMAGWGRVYRSIAPYLGGCPAGRLYCNIQPNGDVTPCMFMPAYPVAGNLRTKSFQEIWNEASVFLSLRDRNCLKGQCKSCAFTLSCGGCRAKAAAYFGDYLAQDPTCPFTSNALVS